MHIYVYVYICIYIYTYIYIYKHIYVYTYINIHTSVGVCVCVCVCVYYDINRRKTWRAPYPHNQIYSRFWYAFSLFLRKFHSVNPFNGNFCELGRAGSLRKRLNFHLRLSAKRTLLYFRPNLDLFRTRSGAVCRPCTINVRNEPVQEMFCVVKCEPPPYWGGNSLSFNIEKAYQFRE